MRARLKRKRSANGKRNVAIWFQSTPWAGSSLARKAGVILIPSAFVIPSAVEEWSGLGSRDIGGRVEGRVSGQRMSQSLGIPVKQNSMRCLGPARHDRKASG